MIFRASAIREDSITHPRQIAIAKLNVQFKLENDALCVIRPEDEQAAQIICS